MPIISNPAKTHWQAFLISGSSLKINNRNLNCWVRCYSVSRLCIDTAFQKRSVIKCVSCPNLWMQVTLNLRKRRRLHQRKQR